MRKIFFSLLLILFFHFLPAQDNLAVQLTQIKSTSDAKHIEPRKLDDSFSSDFFALFLQHLDPGFVYFNLADIKTVEKFRFSLDDEIINSKLIFFHDALQLYKSKLKKAESLVNTICSKPFDFDLDEFYDHALDTVWAASEKQWEQKWHYILKLEVLNSLAGIASHQYFTKNTINKAEVLAREPQFRERIKNKYISKLKSLAQSDESILNFASDVYLNSFLSCIDPHSAYMNITERQNFESGLNTEGYYFGFTFDDTEKGEVAIVQLQPGGPAWTSGMIHKDDILLQLKWSGKENINLAGLNASEVSQLMDESNTEKMELTLRKQNGKVETVVLQKRKLENQENIVKSYVLKGERNIGYITLPSFYTEWEDAAGSRCANDVATEVVKLKKDSISGLILDLRYNGGGSIQEAIEMAGIFIDEGAICQLNVKGEKLITLKDVNRGMIYTGPLLILVNGYSASASELLAGSLQDYNRAIIVGSRTHGKATGQQIIPLENKASTVSNSSGNGFLKLTTSKLYRVTGKSSQIQGVVPDVQLPDPYEGFGEYESDNNFAIKHDTVARYKYFKPLKEFSKSGLQQKSSARITANQKFKELAIHGKMIGATLKKIDLL